MIAPTNPITNPIAQTGIADTFEPQLERQAVKPCMAARPPQRCRHAMPRADDCAHAFVNHHGANDSQQCHVREPDHQIELVQRTQFGEKPDTGGRTDDAGTEQHHCQRDIECALAPIADRAGKRRRRDMTGYGCHGDCRRDPDEDQQRRHQETAADAEHARDVADRESHPQHKEDVHGQVGDGKVDLQAGSSDGCDALRRPARPATSY
jgi:hypothetical protein